MRKKIGAVCAGAALADPQPITDLPLIAEGDNRWTLPAGEYVGNFRIDRPLHLRCEPGAVFSAAGSAT